MRYVIRCHCCTGPEVVSDELRADQRCPKCESVPGSYDCGGEEYCWLHRERMMSTYPVSPLFLFTSYAWRGRWHLFPNAKLYEEPAGEGTCSMSTYCQACQRLYEDWLNNSREE